MNKILLIVLALTASTVNAEIFKCKSTKTGATEYQSFPCASPTLHQESVAIKPISPQEAEQARLKLQAWQDKQAEIEKAKIQAAKERQAELDKQTELNALTRSATAAEEQAQATQRLAGEIEHQNRINRYNSLYVPQHHYGQPNDPDDDPHRRRHGHEGRHPRRHTEGMQHAPQLGDYGVYRPPGSLGNSVGE